MGTRRTICWWEDSHLSLSGAWIAEYGWSACTDRDVDLLEVQMGRRPHGVLAVALRCRYGSPQVIVNDPAPTTDAGVRRPFPTLFWLSCAHLVSAVSALESEGWVAKMRRRLLEDEQLARAMEDAHREYAALRLAMCDPQAVEQMKRKAPQQYRVLAESGVAGIVAADGVKCLHTHLADYLGRRGRTGDHATSAVNPIGRMTAQLLLERGVDLKGSVACQGCPHEDVCRALRVQRRALTVIDIGSNSLRLLKGVWSAGEGEERLSEWVAQDRRRATTRLGARGADGEALGEEAVARSIDVLDSFSGSFSPQDPAPVAVATAAVRRSARGGEFLLRVWETTRISAPILSEEDEARLSFLGAVKGLASLKRDNVCVVIDVGGGSTEVAFGWGSGVATERISLPIGAVVAADEYLSTDPPRGVELRRLQEALDAMIPVQLGGDPEDGRPRRVIAVGGTATTAVAIHQQMVDYDPERVHAAVLETEALATMTAALAQMPFADRRRVTGLEPERADVIVAGLLILHTLLVRLAASSVIVSESDILQGLLWENFGPTGLIDEDGV